MGTQNILSRTALAPEMASSSALNVNERGVTRLRTVAVHVYKPSRLLAGSPPPQRAIPGTHRVGRALQAVPEAWHSGATSTGEQS